RPIVVTRAGGVAYAREPALLAAVRAAESQGRFDGALVAVITLASLRPQIADRSLPADSEVALAGPNGNWLSTTRTAAFPASLDGRLFGPAASAPSLWFGPDRAGALRVFSSAPLVGRDVYVILSAPSRRLISWAWLNAVSVLGLPLLGFSLALAAVLIVAERGVVRWIAYLQRIAAIYARGRFSVHPIKAELAPPEIRDLAETLDGMAQTIAARDAALKDSLSEKDDLMREIHHRVKNNLQVISSLINMQQRSLADAGARAAMSDTRQRIGALALVYRALYQGADLKRVDLREFLDELIAQLVMAEPAMGGPVKADLAIDPLIIDPDRLAPLALFAVEAITNAKKHGLGAAGGVLSVTFRVRGRRAELVIADTGAGGGKPAIGEGVGRTLMTAFARQLRGEVVFRANRAGGLTARLLFPTPDMEGPSQDGAEPFSSIRR
ncbi:MAG: sensor histidine kinase, partial [Caulobacteraceae bacterium]